MVPKEKKKAKKKIKSIKVIIDGKEFEAEVKVFSTGRKGYGLYKILRIENYPHRINLNIMEIG